MILQDKTVVVVGGGSGIGRAVAARALAEGAKVVITGRSEEKLAAAKAALGDVGTLAFDAGDPAACEAAYKTLGPIDHLITTAAALTYAPVADISLDAVRDTISSKIWGPFLAARFAAPLIRTGGSMTFFTGLAAYRPGPGTAIVATVNAGLEGLIKALAVELAPLRVNGISPGVTETPGWDFMDSSARAALFAELRNSLPARRIGAPEDLAAATLLLMTNPYITGTVLDVDGGGRLS